EVFVKLASACDDLAVRVHNVAIAVSDSVCLRVLRDIVVAADEVYVVFHGASGMVRAYRAVVFEQVFLVDEIVMRGEDDLRALGRQNASRLDVAAVGTDHDAELHVAALEDRKLPSLLLPRLVGGALTVDPKETPLVHNRGRIVVIRAPQLTKADHRC